MSIRFVIGRMSVIVYFVIPYVAVIINGIYDRLFMLVLSANDFIVRFYYKTKIMRVYEVCM